MEKELSEPQLQTKISEKGSRGVKLLIVVIGVAFLVVVIVLWSVLLDRGYFSFTPHFSPTPTISATKFKNAPLDASFESEGIVQEVKDGYIWIKKQFSDETIIGLLSNDVEVIRFDKADNGAYIHASGILADIKKNVLVGLVMTTDGVVTMVSGYP